MTVASPHSELQRQLASHNVVPVVGAGLSSAAAGVPGWGDMLRQFAAKLRAAGVAPATLSDLDTLLNANRFTDAGALVQEAVKGIAHSSYYTSILRELFDIRASRITDRTLPEALWHLNPPYVLTTNYDRILELTGPPGIETVTWQDLVPFAQAARDGGAVVHLHGVFNRPDTVVFSVSDYDRLNASGGYRATMQGIWTHRTLLFIGASRDGVIDPDFTQLWKWAAEAFPAFPYSNYLLMRTGDMQPEQRLELLGKYRVEVIEFGTEYTDLPLYLDSLGERSGAVLPASVPESASARESTVVIASPPTVVVTTPAPAVLTARRNKVDDSEMVWIPEGFFLMGGDRSDREKPVHPVMVSGFWIYKTPVTVAQFRKYDEENGKKYDWEGRKPGWDWQDDHPMVNVVWAEASAYAKWAGVALPTEAQWEKAARGGLEGKQYPWGDDWDGSRCANSVGDNKLASTRPVASYDPNDYGIYDMAGNVWEWCADWYDATYYKTEAARGTDPVGPVQGTSRVLRGGSWFYVNQYYFRCAYRGTYQPVYWFSGVGFRCVAPGLPG